MKKGQLDKINLTKILSWICKGNRTGTLTISRNDTNKHSIFCRNGQIIYVHSKKPIEQVENIIIKKDYLSEATLTLARGNTKGNGTDLIKSLSKMNLLNEEQIEDINRTQMSETLTNLFFWIDGEFTFYPDRIPAKGFQPTVLPMDMIMSMGKKKLNKWEELKKNLPRLKSKAIAKIRVERDNWEMLELLPMERKILEIADGTITIEEILHTICPDLIHSACMVKDLIDRDLLNVEGIKENLEEAKTLHRKRKFFQSVEILKELSKDFPDNEEIKNIYKQYQSDLFQEIKNQIVSLRSIPELTENSDLQSWRELNLDAKTVFILSRIDGVINIHQLISASGLKKGALCMMIYRLLELDLINLKMPEQTNNGQVEEARFALDTELTDKEQDKIERVLTKFRKLKKEDYYRVLELKPSANISRVKKAHFNLAKEFHPDTFNGKIFAPLKPKVEEIFNRIQEAYEVLSDNNLRDEYNEKLGLKEQSEARLMKKRINAKAQLQFKIGMKCFQKRDYPRAIEFIKSAIDLDSENPVYYIRLAEVMKKNPKWYSQAKEHALHAIELTPQDPYIYSIYASILHAEGLLEEATDYYYKALQIDPSDETATAALEEITGGPVKPREVDFSAGKKMVIRKKKNETS